MSSQKITILMNLARRRSSIIDPKLDSLLWAPIQSIYAFHETHETIQPTACRGGHHPTVFMSEGPTHLQAGILPLSRVECQRSCKSIVEHERTNCFVSQPLLKIWFRSSKFQMPSKCLDVLRPCVQTNSFSIYFGAESG